MTDETTTTTDDTTTTTTTPPAAPDFTGLPDTVVKDGAIDVEALKAHVATLAPRAADIPASADAYDVAAIEGVDVAAIKESTLFKTLAASAHEQGIGQAAFAKTIGSYIEAETAKATEFETAQRTALGENADARIAAVGTWLGSKLPADKAAALQAMTTTAAAVEALEALMGTAPAPRTPAPAPAATDTKEDIEKLQASPEYWNPKKRDPAVVKRVQDYYEAQAAAKKA